MRWAMRIFVSEEGMQDVQRGQEDLEWDVTVHSIADLSRVGASRKSTNGRSWTGVQLRDEIPNSNPYCSKSLKPD
jgi:hypothetical protein